LRSEVEIIIPGISTGESVGYPKYEHYSTLTNVLLVIICKTKVIIEKYELN
jgi:hypothetical protein